MNRLKLLIAFVGALTFFSTTISVYADIAALSAVSRKTHGAAGAFDVALPVTGVAGIECRWGGSDGLHQIVVSFAQPVTLTEANLITGIGSVSSATANGSEVTVNLTGIADAQRIAVRLSNVSDGTTSNDVIVPMNVLTGDINGTFSVNATDKGLTQVQVGHPVSASNFRTDVVVNGAINSSDVGLVKGNSGSTLTTSTPKFDKLASGVSSASLLLQSDGILWSWGLIPGDGGEQSRGWPLPLSSLPNVVSVSAGDSHVGLLRSNGLVWSWGKNQEGQVGDGTITDRISPVMVETLSNVIFCEGGWISYSRPPAGRNRRRLGTEFLWPARR
jgi:hypothetical protein